MFIAGDYHLFILSLIKRFIFIGDVLYQYKQQIFITGIPAEKYRAPKHHMPNVC